jgi:hypothetical protein
MPTPVDSVEEFKSNTANQTADFDNSSGAQIQIVTKRGTDKWHGTAYEYYLDNNLNANSWQNNYTSTPIPDYHYNRYGFAGGGPVIPGQILGGKTYFFANELRDLRARRTVRKYASGHPAISGCQQ